MPIKTTEEEKIQKEPYPILKYSTELGFIVLFTEEKTGTIVNKNKYWSIGYHCKSWVEEKFSPYQGKLTLENE